MNLRAFDNKAKKFIDSFLITQNGKVVIQEKQSGWQQYNNVLVDATLCRSTERKDKDGKEIFNHDVISISFGEPPKCLKFLVCENEEGDFYLKSFNHDCRSSIRVLNIEKMNISLIGSSLANPHFLR